MSADSRASGRAAGAGVVIMQKRRKASVRSTPNAATIINVSTCRASCGPCIAAWRAYGHAMLSETVVVHNIKSSAEYVAISAYYERYRVEMARAARGGGGAPTAATGAANAGPEPWTVTLRPVAEADDGLDAIKRMRKQIT